MSSPSISSSNFLLFDRSAQENSASSVSVCFAKTADNCYVALVKNPNASSVVYVLQGASTGLRSGLVLTDATVSKGRSYVAFTAGGTNGTTIVFKLSEDRLYTGGGNVYTGFGVIESSEPNLSSLIQNGLDNNAGATLPAGMPFGCACNANGSSASNCDSGGQGSTECMTTSSLSVGVGYTTGCSVSCGGGYYSCCTN